MDLGARKPVGFLGSAGSTLVGKVDHPNWHQGSDRLRRGRGKATGARFKLTKVQLFFGEPSRYFTNKGILKNQNKSKCHFTVLNLGLGALPGKQSTTEWYQSHGSKSGTRGLAIDVME